MNWRNWPVSNRQILPVDADRSPTIFGSALQEINQAEEGRTAK